MSRRVSQPNALISMLTEHYTATDQQQGTLEGSLAGSSAHIDFLLAQFETHWDRGENPRAEDFIEPSMSDEAVLALIYHEYCLREIAGEAPASSLFTRFPAYRERLERLLSVGALVDLASITSQKHAAVEWPDVGELVGPYRLTRTLGSGSFSRVFLAQQTDLADRPVVIKLSPRPSPEPQLLARARHPHIVEVLRHGATDDGRLHLICMPYMGGATLSSLLDQLRKMKSARLAAPACWLDLLDQLARPDEGDAYRDSATERLVRSLNPTQTVCWMVARLAQALDAAHRRGVLHGDVKPSNILVAPDGKPLLLDFNLAVEWRIESPAEVGGTLAYMSPDRLNRLLTKGESDAPGSDRPVLRDCDLYSLGLVLFESLTLASPPTPSAGAADDGLAFARRMAEARSDPAYIEQLVTRPGVPPSLRPILHRCLAPRIGDRYARGNELADDLDRWIAFLPMQHAEQPSVVQRLHRWSLRHRGRLTLTLAALLVAAVASVVAWRLIDAKERRVALEKLNALWSGTEPGVFRFEWAGAWRQDEPVETARIADRVLRQFDVLGAADWRTRRDVMLLPPAARFDLELWLLEHTWKYAEALASSGSTEQEARALELLNRDHSWAALDEFQQLRLRLNSQSAGSGVRAKTVATDPVLETYARGLSLEARHARRAQHQFALVLARHPDSFWANYRIAACACRLGDYEEAAERLRHCLRRLPGNATLWTQLAACLIQIDRIDDAEQACDEALRLSPQLLEARQARAILYSRANQKARLKEDLQLFGWLTAHVDAIKRWDLMVLLEYAQRRNKDGSVATRESEPQLSGIQAEDAMAHALRGCLREWDGQWREAIAEYDRALASNSDHLWALYRRGQVKSRFDARAAHRDYETLVHHDRAEELFGQQPQALRVYYFLIVSRLRDAGRSADVTLRKRQHSDAIAMARIAAERAELAREPSLIVEMKMLLARTLVAATESPSNASAEVAELVRSASILDPVRTHELLTTDRLFTTPLRAPSWIPRRDPARRFLSPDRMSR